MERILFLGIAFIAFSALIRAEVPAPVAGVEITGAGARFPYPVYVKWFEEYGKIDPSVRFHYQPVGSDGGRDQILAATNPIPPRRKNCPRSSNGLKRRDRKSPTT